MTAPPFPPANETNKSLPYFEVIDPAIITELKNRHPPRRRRIQITEFTLDSRLRGNDKMDVSSNILLPG